MGQWSLARIVAGLESGTVRFSDDFMMHFLILYRRLSSMADLLEDIMQSSVPSFVVRVVISC